MNRKIHPRTFAKGGIHPHDSKLTRDVAITQPVEPERVTVLLNQSIGAEPRLLVKAGDPVRKGQMIAEPGGYVSAALHSPVGGTVKSVTSVRDPYGYPSKAIEIIKEGDQEPTALEPLDFETATPAQIVERVAACGIVGLGGATFPTRVKLEPGKEYRPEYVIINGAECEPWLTCDDRLMREHASEVVSGARWLMRAVKVEKCFIGIEENKQEAIAAMTEAASHRSGVTVVPLKKKYPQGGEKQLIQAIIGRQVPSGSLPVYVGAIVDNVATAFAVCEAAEKGLPLTRRVVTVTGPDLANPGNFLTDIGTPVSALIEAAGGLPEDTGKVVAGGPMMGRAMSYLDTPTTKGMSGILVLPSRMSRRPDPQPCIRCGSCVEVCPMGLEPFLIAAQGEMRLWESTLRSGVMDCIECGSCMYTCPAARPLLDYIRLSKRESRKLK